jgi:plasmid stabilization system protein ParE
MGDASIEFHPDAVEELAAACEWYSERSDRAADAFSIELDRAIGQISSAPRRWAKYLHGTRHFVLPFVVVYREFESRVQVITVAHAKRRPGYWQGRLSS